MPTTPADTVHSFMKAMETVDFDTALKVVSVDCEYVNPPPIGSVRGHASIRAVLGPFFGNFRENEFRILRQAAVGAVVMLERLDRHRLGDRWVELPVTGVYEVQDGLITYWRDYFDYPTIAGQLPPA